MKHAVHVIDAAYARIEGACRDHRENLCNSGCRTANAITFGLSGGPPWSLDMAVGGYVLVNIRLRRKNVLDLPTIIVRLDLTISDVEEFVDVNGELHYDVIYNKNNRCERHRSFQPGTSAPDIPDQQPRAEEHDQSKKREVA